MGSRTESKAEKERQKQIQDKCQNLINEMLRDDDNKYCVDCDAKGPRWASWNLGVFLCIRCAGIHRNLGVHISKVKSVNLDTWTPEQVVSLQQMGNSRARAVYEASLPDTWRRPQTDSSLETFIRAKYQHKRYIAKEWVPPPLPKVDWDKELDEEARRQKEKRRDRQAVNLPPVQSVVSNPVIVPALPKPTNSPKSSRTSRTAVSDDIKQTSSAVDLLGLNTSNTTSSSATNGNSDDVFSSFLSAAPAAPTNIPPVASATVPSTSSSVSEETNDSKGRSAEEDSFFNQAAPSAEQKKALTKDSILALYSSQTTAPAQPTIFHNPGLFPSNQNVGFPPANPATGFPSVGSHSGFPVASGFPIQTGAVFPSSGAGFSNGIHPPTGSIPPAAANPFYGMSAGLIPAQGFPVQHVSSNSSKPSDDLLVDFVASPSSSNALHQQLSGLNLGQPAGGAPNFAALSTPFSGLDSNFVNSPPQAAMGQTFTTNLWQ